WNTVRKNLELNFRFTRRSLAVISLFGLASPILLASGRPHKRQLTSLTQVAQMRMIE
ncbi:hypothetical protein ZWY2020_027145, partial [Hordeum vulgare]